MRVGTKAIRLDGRKPEKGVSPRWYCLDGVLQAGFKVVGKSAMQKDGIDGSGHQLSFLSISACVADILQDREVARALTTMRTLVVLRGHDASPVTLQFGHLQDLIAPHARYLHKVDDQWRLLTYCEYIALGKKARPRAGTVEVF